MTTASAGAGRAWTSSQRWLVGGFAVVVLSHWAEHLLQAVQIWGLGWPRAAAGGALGLAAPGLATSELLHVVYNEAVLTGIAVLLPAFSAIAR